jgi:ribosomal protein S27AE
MPNTKDMLPQLRRPKDRCPACSGASRYLFMGIEELERWAHDLGVPKEIAHKAITCPRCGTVYHEVRY